MVALPPASPLPRHDPHPSSSLQTQEVGDGTLWPACLGGFRPGPWTISTICSHSLVSWLSLGCEGREAELETQTAPESAHLERCCCLSPRTPRLPLSTPLRFLTSPSPQGPRLSGTSQVGHRWVPWPTTHSSPRHLLSTLPGRQCWFTGDQTGTMAGRSE